MATPLLNPLRVNGGTFYSFTSSTNDLSRTFADDDTRFVFSKFVLCDLPDVATPTSNYENYVVWEGIGSQAGAGTSSVPTLHADENLNFAESLQNYALNFEQLVLEGRNNLAQAYDVTEKATPSERIFWKWLTQINALRFRDATSAEAATSARYTEPDTDSYYKRVVKYIGDIDIVNSVRKDGQSYSECYMHVPTSHGNTPVILWKALADANYSPGMIWSNGNVYVDGRDAGSVHPSGLELRAYYDSDLNDQYIAGGTFGNVTTVAGTATFGSPKPVALSSMDGAVLDFSPESYKPIVDDPTIAQIGEFNATDAAEGFQFNAVLVYYDVYRESDPADRATNLFGILVLDDYVNQGGGYAYLKRYEKFKPNAITKLNGNSYGLKFDIKFDTSIDNAGVEVVVNEYNTFSMDLFADTMVRLQESADLFRDNLVAMVSLRERLGALEQVYYSQDQLRDLEARVTQWEAALANARLSMASSNTYLDLVNRLADNLQEIVEGRTTLNVAFNLDLIKDGPGTKVDRSVPGQVRMRATTQQYNVMLSGNADGKLKTTFSNGTSHASTTEGNVLVLTQYTNYFKQVNANPDPMSGIEVFGDNLYINIDDTAGFSRGQTVRVVFQGPIDVAGHNIVIWTDALDRFGGGAFEKMIGTVYETELLSDRPILEIVCIDETTYQFDVNVLR